jgi:putative Mn2+ efflux pump MntP
MGFIEILLIAVGLAMDAFAVSLAAGALKEVRGARATFRLSFHFGLFQFLMPVIGWYAGSNIVGYIEAFDHWIAFGLLGYVGGRMVLSGLANREESFRGDPSRGYLLITLSVATSIDALAVGLSLAMIQVSIWYPSVVIGVVAGVLSIVGVGLGRRLGLAFGKRMEVAGGIILVLIGLRILYAHLTGGA